MISGPTPTGARIRRETAPHRRPNARRTTPPHLTHTRRPDSRLAPRRSPRRIRATDAAATHAAAPQRQALHSSSSRSNIRPRPTNSRSPRNHHRPRQRREPFPTGQPCRRPCRILIRTWRLHPAPAPEPGAPKQRRSPRRGCSPVGRRSGQPHSRRFTARTEGRARGPIEGVTAESVNGPGATRLPDADRPLSRIAGVSRRRAGCERVRGAPSSGATRREL